MKLLKELVDIVTRQRIEKVNLIDISQEDEPGSHYGKFYNALRVNEIKTDNDAARLFYNTNSLDDKYRQLKSRFKKRLLNYLIFMDVNKSSYSNYAKAYHTCNKNLILCRILLNHGARYTFDRLARQTLKQAIKFDFNNIIVPLAGDLMINYSLIGNKKEYDQLLSLFNRRKLLLDAEYECDRLQEQIIINFVASNLKTEKILEITTSNIKRIEELNTEFDSYKLNFNLYYIKAIYFQIINDYVNLIEICDEAEQYYEKNLVFYQKTALAKFSLMKMPALLNLRHHNKGLEALSKSLTYFTIGQNNWLMTMEAYFLLTMQAANYTHASEIFLNAVNQPKFKYANPIRKERWKIFYAYLHYIFEVHELDKSLLQNKYIHGFRPQTFLGNTPLASKDKTGLNIAILTLQIQFLFKNGKIDDIFDKTDALGIYAYRYLNKKENSRAYLYIKMLQIAEKKSFIYKYAYPATNKIHKQLESEVDSYSAEWEILPYDRMWEQALDFMKMHE